MKRIVGGLCPSSQATRSRRYHACATRVWQLRTAISSATHAGCHRLSASRDLIVAPAWFFFADDITANRSSRSFRAYLLQTPRHVAARSAPAPLVTTGAWGALRQRYRPTACPAFPPAPITD